MESITPSQSIALQPSTSNALEQVAPFSQQWVTITKEEHIALIHQANYWNAQHAQLKLIPQVERNAQRGHPIQVYYI